MSCDEAIGRTLGLSDAYDSKSTDQESIGSEIVAVEDVDSDGWVDAKDNSELVEAFGSASLTDVDYLLLTQRPLCLELAHCSH